MYTAQALIVHYSISLSGLGAAHTDVDVSYRPPSLVYIEGYALQLRHRALHAHDP